MTARDDILARAVAWFAEHGVADTSLRTLAAAIGTSHRMLNYHFGSRDGLLAAVVEVVERGERRALADLLEGATDPRSAGESFWPRVADAAEVFAPLFFELSGHAMQSRPHALGLRAWLADGWSPALIGGYRDLGHDRQTATTLARLSLAVARGLLFEVAVGGRRADADQAMDTFSGMVAAVPPPAQQGGPTPRRGATRVDPRACATDPFPGFTRFDLDVDGATIHGVIGGAGPAALLLHGYPQTHAMWHPVAPLLAADHTVVAIDLRGYGRSRTGTGDLTFRAMAADAVAVMGALGAERFAVIGHDRGARTTHRLVLDHPTVVTSIALLDILPTLDVWRLMDSWLAQRYWHWPFLAQPGGLPEALINGDPVGYLHRALGGLGGDLSIFDPVALADYEAAARRRDVVAAWCADYRAAAGTDLEHDRADAGRTSPVPTLVLWGAHGVVGRQEDPLTLWRRHFPAATGRSLRAGHFLVEEVPDQVCPLLAGHLTGR